MQKYLLHDEEIDVGSLLQSGIVQHLVRTIADGREQIVGLFRCDFQLSQQLYTLNIPIHPPLADTPGVEAMAIEQDVRIRVTDRQRFGIRLEISWPEVPAESNCVFLEIAISSLSH